MCRHTPFGSPTGVCGIVGGFQGCQRISIAVVTIFSITAVFGEGGSASIAILVGFPVVVFLWCCFAPSKVVAVVHGIFGTYVHICPLCAVRQSKVNIIVSGVLSAGSERFYFSVACAVAVDCVGTVAVGGIGCKSRNRSRKVIGIVCIYNIFCKVFRAGTKHESTLRDV